MFWNAGMVPEQDAGVLCNFNVAASASVSVSENINWDTTAFFLKFPSKIKPFLDPFVETSNEAVGPVRAAAVDWQNIG